jgi:hypothetical protein
MSTAALKGCHEVQNLGAVQTYIRRYLWVTAMEIVEHDALEATTGKDQTADENAEWAEGLAMQVRSLMSKQDIKGAAEVLNMLGVGGSYDAEAKEAVWRVLEIPTRSAIKAYDAISQAKTLDALKLAWDAAPKHSHAMLGPVKDQRKAELMPEQAAA